MITSDEKKQKVLASLRSHANPQVRFNHRSRLPIILSSKDKTFEKIWTDNVIIERDFGIERPKILTDTINGYLDKNPSEEDIIVLLEKMYSQMQLWQRKIFVVDKFHYDDRWFPYKFSVDEPQYTFGILKVHDIPYNTFEGKRNKRSFVCSMYDLIFNEYCEPFMVFVNGQFVNWNYIDVVFDCNDTYLLLHGEKYNYYNLKAAQNNIFIAILPFKINFIGTESAEHFDMMYDITRRYIQDSLVINNKRLSITIPSVDEVYEYRKMVYNVGAWLYNQLRYHKYGMLSQDRISKLKKMEITKVDRDASDNIISTLTTKFNALDKDSYDKAFYDKITYGNVDVYSQNAIFRFNDNGSYQYNGNNIIALLDNNLTYNNVGALVNPGEHTTLVDHHVTNNKYVKYSYFSNTFKHRLFRENYMIFKDGLFYGDLEVDESMFNTIGFSNSESKRCDIMVFYHKPIEHLISHIDHFSPDTIVRYIQESLPNPYADNSNSWVVINDSPIYTEVYGTSPIITIPKGLEITCENTSTSGWYKITSIISSGASNYSLAIGKYISSISYSRTQQIISKDTIIADRREYFEKCLKCLRILYRDGWIYRDNWYYNGMKNVVPYDPLVLMDLYESNIYSTVLTGKEVNDSLNKPYTYESRNGLKIPRHKYENHESYVMVFENGELLPEYSKMIAYSNFFFIPMDRQFNNASTIELLWFNKVDNNQIEFDISNYMINNMDAKDSKWLKWKDSTMFNQYIKPEDLKIFVNYPEEIMVYKKLVPESENIAFNISYRDDDNELYLMKNIVENDLITDDNNMDESNTYTAVSSRKFIYQRLYVDQRAFRIELDKRFKFCDNQKQYMLFIDGRRMDDDSFLVTIPKYDRPFWGMYLYTAKFVKPSSRIELFYVPEEMVDVNFYKNFNLNKDGYINIGKTVLDAPLDPKLFMFFINGKKIAPTDIISVDTHTVRMKKDTFTTNDLLINPIYVDAVDDIKKYMKDPNGFSSYDGIIYDIKNNQHLGYLELDKLFNSFVKMTSDGEPNLTRANVGRIAIVNEIVRDFWVSSGYPYNDAPFIYDYQMDSYITIDRNHNAIIPALDANQIIHIPKNEFRLISFTNSPIDIYDPDEFYEIGSSLNYLDLAWEYGYALNTKAEDYNIVSQKIIADVYTEDREVITKEFDDIPVNLREWRFDYNNKYKTEIRNGELPSEIRTDIDFHFTADREFQILQKDFSIKFVNGIYYGNIDEDMLQHFSWGTNLIALEPNDGYIPRSERQSVETPEYTASSANELNRIIRNIGYVVDSESVDTITATTNTISFVNALSESELLDKHSKHPVVPEYVVAQDFNGIIGAYGPYLPSDFEYTDLEYSTNGGYGLLRDYCNVVYQLSPELILDNYILGNNNYFVYACPRRLAYDKDNNLLIEFIMPDPRSEDILSKNRDDEKATPIYTTGNWSMNDHNLLEPLDEMKMVYLGVFYYTNKSGYTEPYCVWRSNGFFTRGFESYGFHIKVRYKDDSRDYDDGLGHIIPAKEIEYGDPNVRSYSINSLTSGTGITANIEETLNNRAEVDKPKPSIHSADNIIFIDDLNL